MNVTDVRDMEQTQWVFWATAIPLAVVIITLCLIWAGELENFLRGVRDVWSRGKNRNASRSFAGERKGGLVMGSGRRDLQNARGQPVININNFPDRDGDSYDGRDDRYEIETPRILMRRNLHLLDAPTNILGRRYTRRVEGRPRYGGY